MEMKDADRLCKRNYVESSEEKELQGQRKRWQED